MVLALLKWRGRDKRLLIDAENEGCEGVTEFRREAHGHSFHPTPSHAKIQTHQRMKTITTMNKM
jgi:hypothetical protein